jgi:hypothetical protein
MIFESNVRDKSCEGAEKRHRFERKGKKKIQKKEAFLLRRKIVSQVGEKILIIEVKEKKRKKIFRVCI